MERLRAELVVSIPILHACACDSISPLITIDHAAVKIFQYVYVDFTTALAKIAASLCIN
jgi:hypothetical protein